MTLSFGGPIPRHVAKGRPPYPSTLSKGGTTSDPSTRCQVKLIHTSGYFGIFSRLRYSSTSLTENLYVK